MFLRGKQTNEPTGDPVPTVPPVVVPPVPSPAPVSAQIPGQNFDREDVYAEDGKKWKDKFNGLRGTLKQLETGYQERVGALEQQIRELQEQLKQAQAALDTANTQIEQLRAIETQHAALQQTVAELEGKAKRAERFRLLVDQPQLLNVRVEQEVPGEDGAEPTTRIVNPFVDLVEQSNLEGDALATLLSQMAAAIPASGQPIPPVTPPAVPPAPIPSGDDLEALERKERELHDKMNQGDMSVLSEWQDLWAQINQLRVQQAA